MAIRQPAELIVALGPLHAQELQIVAMEVQRHAHRTDVTGPIPIVAELMLHALHIPAQLHARLMDAAGIQAAAVGLTAAVFMITQPATAMPDAPGLLPTAPPARRLRHQVVLPDPSQIASVTPRVIMISHVLLLVVIVAAVK